MAKSVQFQVNNPILSPLINKIYLHIHQFYSWICFDNIGSFRKLSWVLLSQSPEWLNKSGIGFIIFTLWLYNIEGSEIFIKNVNSHSGVSQKYIVIFLYF